MHYPALLILALILLCLCPFETTAVILQCNRMKKKKIVETSRGKLSDMDNELVLVSPHNAINYNLMSEPWPHAFDLEMGNNISYGS